LRFPDSDLRDHGQETLDAFRGALQGVDRHFGTCFDTKDGNLIAHLDRNIRRFHLSETLIRSKSCRSEAAKRGRSNAALSAIEMRTGPLSPPGRVLALVSHEVSFGTGRNRKECFSGAWTVLLRINLRQISL
jgi:hypothetical protein